MPDELATRPLARQPVRLGAFELGGARSLICVPVVAHSWQDLHAEASSAARLQPDVIEWRADYLSDLSPADVARAIAVLRTALACPLLVTCRAATEGGNGTWTDTARLAILEAALDAGTDIVDVESATVGRERILKRGALVGRPVIFSEHHFDDTPDMQSLLGALEQQQAAGAAVAKLAVMPRQSTDVTRLLDACFEARRTFLRVPLVAMAMARLGAYSRVVAPLYGVDFTFAAGSRESAPGQLGIDELRACRASLGIP